MPSIAPTEVTVLVKLLMQNLPSRAPPAILKQWNEIVQHGCTRLLWTRSARKEPCHSNTLASGFPTPQAVHNSAICAYRASVQQAQLQFLQKVRKERSLPLHTEKQRVVNDSPRRKTPRRDDTPEDPHTLLTNSYYSLNSPEPLSSRFLGIHRTPPLRDVPWKGTPINCIRKAPQL